MSANNFDPQKLLDAFLVGNDDLEQLNARLASFNLFNVLRIERAEIRHSNVLAWLLTPGESHGLGDAFLRRFLSTLLMESDPPNVTMTAANVELMELRDAELLREWRNIDIVAHSPTGRWCLVIENKIGSKESPDQLKRYRNSVAETFPECQRILVLLTVEGDEPSEKARELGYVSATHATVLEITETMRIQYHSRIPEDAKVFLDHYIDVLRRITMQDEVLAQLCKRIYRRHREAIDLIVEYGTATQVIDFCDQTINTLSKCEFTKASSGMLRFMPDELGKRLPEVDLTLWKDLPRPTPIVWFFLLNKKVGKLHLICEVGPIADHALRVRLLDAIKKAGFNFSESAAYKKTALYTRFLSTSRKLRTRDDGGLDDSLKYIAKLVTEMWEGFAESQKKLVSVMSRFEWKSK